MPERCVHFKTAITFCKIHIYINAGLCFFFLIMFLTCLPNKGVHVCLQSVRHAKVLMRIHVNSESGALRTRDTECHCDVNEAEIVASSCSRKVEMTVCICCML